MKYSYKCGCASGQEITEHKCGEAPADLGYCPFCQQLIARDLAADLPDIVVGVADPFRSYALSAGKMHEEARQGRRIGGPEDNAERKRLESLHGIQYVGSDTSGLTAAGRRGIETYQEKKRSGEVQ